MPRHLSKAIPSDSSASVATAPDKNAVKKKAAIKDARPPKPGKPSFIRPETSKAGDSRPASKSKSNRFLASAKPEPERLHKILEILDQMYPLVTTALQHQNPLELLVATILSAQCTDERVNQVTPVLFRKYPDATALANASIEEIEEIIHSVNFYHGKAKSIKNSCRLLVDKFHSQVPREMEQLLELPGVARKTANVVLGSAYGVALGIVVDTHVKRVSQRLGFTTHDDPVPIEQDLMEIIPRERWINFSHQLIYLGRSICQARKPRHEECPLAPFCPSATMA